MKFKIRCLLLLTCWWPGQVWAQQQYTLADIIKMGKENSPAALQAQNRKENRYWQYKTFQSNYKPQLRLDGSLPDFNRSIDRILQDDGSDRFVERSLATSDLELSLRQSVGITGTEIYVSSALQRIDIFGDNASSSYLARPFNIGFNQELFGFNELRWYQQIEPIRYEESVQGYIEEMENVSIQATERFFNLLLAQISLQIAEKNQSNNDTILKIARGRYSLGKIAENDLLQLELNLMTSEQQVIQAKLDMETSRLALNSYIGRPGNEQLKLRVPEQLPQFEVSPEQAISEAKNNRQAFLAFKRRRLEAERNVARARGESGLNMNLSGSLGLTRSANDLPSSYQDLEDQQRIRLGFSIPVLDWGRQKARVQTAEADKRLVSSSIAQEEIAFEQEIYTKVKQLEILRLQVASTEKADEIAQRRYFIAQKRYMVAKISITDLNIALQEKDQAKRNYLQSLRNFWKAYFEIRQLTLYDFEQNQKISY